MLFHVRTITEKIPDVLEEQRMLGRTYFGQIHDAVPDRITLVFESGAKPTTNADAFFRLRASLPQTIFDSKQIVDNQPLFWDDAVVNGTGTTSTYNANQASTTIAVSNAEIGHRARQTRRWLNYEPGKSQNVIMTSVMSGNALKRLGQFNERNGMFFQHHGVFSIGLRSYTSGSAVDIIIPQSQWNIDTMDGSGNSGISLDHTKTNIFFFDYEWLGVGTVRYGVFYDGVPYYVHAIHNANNLEVVYMSTPNLPLRYEVINDGTDGASSITHICTTVITEGGRQNIGVPLGINRETNSLTTNNNAEVYPLIAVRLKSTHFGAFIRLIDYSVVCTTTAEYAIYVILNPTVVGTALSFSDQENSAVQVAFGTNATTLTGGRRLFTTTNRDTQQASGQTVSTIDTDLAIGSSIDGTPDFFVLAVQRVTGGAETFFSSINISETL